MKILKKLAWMLLVIVILLQGVIHVNPTRANDQPYPAPNATGDQPASLLPTIPLYLPMLNYYQRTNFTPGKNIFGIESWYFGPTPPDSELIKETGAYWLRRNSLEWMAVEPTPGVRNWSSVANLEKELTFAAAQNKQILLIIRKTPIFARKVADSPCGPINDNSLDEFANFMHDVVQRYSVPPYNVKYFEIWNEQDAPVVSRDDIYGCWGDAKQDYYGGRYYGRVLKQVYPKMKQANPAIQVLIGGLVVDCDPTNPPTGKNCTPATYFEGILVEGAGDYFDGINFHAYDYYYQGLGKFGNVNWHSAWNTTGPSLVEKTRFLKSVMEKYGVTKPLYLTEVSLLCDSSCGDVFQTTKSYFLVQTYVTSLVEGLESVVWYHFFDVWRNSGLVSMNIAPHQAYYAFKFAQSKLGNTLGAKDVSYDNVSAYEILTPNGTLWVAWSKNGSTQTLNLPNVPTGGWDVYGNPINVGQSMQITIAPVYVQLP